MSFNFADQRSSMSARFFALLSAALICLQPSIPNAGALDRLKNTLERYAPFSPPPSPSEVIRDLEKLKRMEEEEARKRYEEAQRILQGGTESDAPASGSMPTLPFLEPDVIRNLEQEHLRRMHDLRRLDEERLRVQREIAREALKHHEQFKHELKQLGYEINGFYYFLEFVWHYAPKMVGQAFLAIQCTIAHGARGGGEEHEDADNDGAKDSWQRCFDNESVGFVVGMDDDGNPNGFGGWGPITGGQTLVYQFPGEPRPKEAEKHAAVEAEYVKAFNEDIINRFQVNPDLPESLRRSLSDSPVSLLQLDWFDGKMLSINILSEELAPYGSLRGRKEFLIELYEDQIKDIDLTLAELEGYQLSDERFQVAHFMAAANFTAQFTGDMLAYSVKIGKSAALVTLGAVSDAVSSDSLDEFTIRVLARANRVHIPESVSAYRVLVNLPAEHSEAKRITAQTIEAEKRRKQAYLKKIANLKAEIQ